MNPPRHLRNRAGPPPVDAPSVDLVFIRLRDGSKFPQKWEQEFVKKVITAVVL